MSGYWLGIVCILGLCYGSFINVLMVRTLSGESIISPPSKCPKCDNLLAWWQNIPIFSYLYLKGRCHYCNTHISMRYPLIELCGMGIFIFAFETYPSIFDAVCVVGILSMFMVLAYTDIKEQKVSTRQSLIIMLCGIIFNRYDILNSILGGLTGGCLIIILTNLGLKFFNKKTFGVGDIYLMGAIGAVVGIDRLLLHIAYILVLQLIYVLPNYIMTLWRNEQSETLKYLIYFIPTCLFFYVFKNAEFFGSNVLSALFLIPLLFLAYKLSKNIVEILKTQETQSYCPLAPAIAISCLMYLL